ncbi:MAG: hypothetical protein JNK81_10900 [Anaerolineales bacterium]|nr:hypothetical protein [Anaerolineales bacterium]
MKREYFYIALAALLLPILARAVWFYRGVADRPEIATPDFASFAAPQPPVNSNASNEDVKQLNGVVVIDQVHGNQFSMTDIVPFTSAIQQRGGKIETLNDAYSLEYQLKYASAFVSISPSYQFTAFEVQSLKNFAERGGRILVFTDPTRNFISVDFVSGNPIAFGDSNAANSLLKGFDITVNNDYLYNTQKNEGNFRNVFFDQFGKSELTFGLKEIALYGTHSLESASGLILLGGSESNLSSSNDAYNPNHGGAVLSADGNVAAFGDATFLSSPYSTYTDNATLISNLADFALTGKQTITLQNFPYIFNGKTVNVYIAPDLNKNTSLITALSGLQSSLRFMNIEMRFVDEVPASGDTIIISTFSLDEDTQAIANKFDIEFGSSIKTVEFGEISSGGTGIFLFDTTSKGNTLVILAGSEDDVITMMGLASGGSINSCLIADNIAVCSVGFGDDFGGGFFEETPFEEFPSEEIPADVEATPTPSG